MQLRATLAALVRAMTAPLPLASLLLAPFLLSATAAADQSDPRLDRLFTTLQKTEDPAAVRAVEQEIWSIWLQCDDEVVNVLISDGMEAMNRGIGRSALRFFDQAVEIEPDCAETWNKRATVRYMLGDYEDSLADIEETLKREPRHFGALSGRGLVYAAQEKMEQALEAFEAALEVNPHMEGVRHNAEAIRRMLDQRKI